MANLKECCVWTRLADIGDPFETQRVQFQAGCNGLIARGVEPIYPDFCPGCSKPVKIKPRDEAPLTSNNESLPDRWRIHVEEHHSETWVVIRGPVGSAAAFHCDAGEARSLLLRKLDVAQKSAVETSVPLSLVKEARLYMQHDRKCWGSTHEDDCDCGFVKIAEKLKPFINGSPVETTDTHPLPCPMCKQRHAPWCPGKSPENTTACRCPGPLRAPFCPVHGDQALPVRQLGQNAAPVLGAEASGDRQASQKASDERVCQCATYCMANAGMKWDPPVKCRRLTGPDPGAHVRFK